MRLLVLMAAALLAGGLLTTVLPSIPMVAVQAATTRIGLDVDLQLCRRFAEWLVCAALTAHAWAIWQHANQDEHRNALRVVAGMFIVAALLAMTASSLETITHTATAT